MPLTRKKKCNLSVEPEVAQSKPLKLTLSSEVTFVSEDSQLTLTGKHGLQVFSVKNLIQSIKIFLIGSVIPQNGFLVMVSNIFG